MRKLRRAVVPVLRAPYHVLDAQATVFGATVIDPVEHAAILRRADDAARP